MSTDDLLRSIAVETGLTVPAPAPAPAPAESGTAPFRGDQDHGHKLAEELVRHVKAMGAAGLRYEALEYEVIVRLKNDGTDAAT